MEKKTKGLLVVGGLGLGMVIGGIVLLKKNTSADEPPDELPPPESGLANLYGKVTSDGVGLSGVLVDLEGVPAITDSLGNYSFANIEPGEYVVALSKEGYNTVSLRRMITEGDNALNVQLSTVESPSEPTAELEILSADVPDSIQTLTYYDPISGMAAYYINPSVPCIIRASGRLPPTPSVGYGGVAFNFRILAPNWYQSGISMPAPHQDPSSGQYYFEQGDNEVVASQLGSGLETTYGIPESGMYIYELTVSAMSIVGGQGTPGNIRVQRVFTGQIFITVGPP